MKKFFVIFLLSLFFPINVQASEIFGRISTNPKENTPVIDMKTEDAINKKVAGVKITAEPEKNIGANIRSWLAEIIKKIWEFIKLPIKIRQAIKG
jgi:hypothetical protein